MISRTYMNDYDYTYIYICVYTYIYRYTHTCLQTIIVVRNHPSFRFDRV